jgi:ADP-heptose:LPS heptosyltransferase
MQGRREIKRILLIRLGGFGDVVFTLPAVHLVRTAFPGARIAFLVYREFAPLLAGFPGIDSVLTLDRRRYRSLNPVTICAETGSLLGHLARGRFDLVVDFQGFGETGWLTWLSRAPHRWGSVYRSARRWSYTRAVWRNPLAHPIDHDLDVLQQGGGLTSEWIRNEFVPPQTSLDQARRFFATKQLDPERPTLFIQPFTGCGHKNWPLEHYLAVARHWRERGMQVLFGGGPGEQTALAPVLQAGFGVAAGAPPLLSAGLVKLSSIVLGGDTGLMHLAVAMAKRVIMIMTSVHPGACIPFGHQEWAVLPPQGLPAAAVTPAAVNQSCAEALAELGISTQPSACVSS